MEMKISGLDDLERKLKKLEKAAESVDGEVKLSELFNESFMRRHSSYPTFDSLLENCGYPCETAEDFEAIPDAEFDAYIRKVTTFISWEEMRTVAAQEHVKKKLGL